MNELNTIVSALSFYALPIATGRAVFAWKKPNLSLPLRLLSYFSLGSIIIYVFTFVISYLSQTPSEYKILIQIFALTILAINILTISRIKIKKSYYLGVLATLLFSAVIYSVWRFNTPYPNPLNWDINEHQLLASEIASGNIAFQTSKLSDTFQFNGYSTMFHTLVSLPQTLFNANPLGFWWMVQMYHLAVTIAVSGLVAYVISASLPIAIIAGVIGGLSFESVVAFTSLFLIPQTLAGTMIAANTALMLEGKSKHKTMFILITLAASFLIHYIIGFVGILIAALIVIYRYFRVFADKKKSLLAIIFLPLLTFLSLNTLSIVFNLGAINSSEASEFTYSASQIVTFTKQFYGYFIFILLPLGIFFSYIYFSKKKAIVSALALIIIAVILSPIPYVLKFYVIGRYFVHTLMAIGLWFAVKKISSKPVKITSIMLPLMALSIVFVLNVARWKQPAEKNGLATHVSVSEQKTADYLKKNFNKQSTIIVSDPATQYVLENLSGINSQGGAYMSLTTRKALDNLLNQETNQTFYNQLPAIRDLLSPSSPATVLLVISGRTIKWNQMDADEKMNIAENIWVPQSVSVDDVRSISEIENRLSIKPLYVEEDVRVYLLPKAKLGELL